MSCFDPNGYGVDYLTTEEVQGRTFARWAVYHTDSGNRILAILVVPEEFGSGEVLGMAYGAPIREP